MSVLLALLVAGFDLTAGSESSLVRLPVAIIMQLPVFERLLQCKRHCCRIMASILHCSHTSGAFTIATRIVTHMHRSVLSWQLNRS